MALAASSQLWFATSAGSAAVPRCGRGEAEVDGGFPALCGLFPDSWGTCILVLAQRKPKTEVMIGCSHTATIVEKVRESAPQGRARRRVGVTQDAEGSKVKKSNQLRNTAADAWYVVAL